MELLSRTEELLLLTILKLGEEAYGLGIRKQMSSLLDRKLSVGAVYVPLERLKKRGLLSSWESEPTDKRGGRAKRFYKLTNDGVRALRAVKNVHEEAWSGIPNLNLGFS